MPYYCYYDSDGDLAMSCTPNARKDMSAWQFINARERRGILSYSVGDVVWLSSFIDSIIERAYAEFKGVPVNNLPAGVRNALLNKEWTVEDWKKGSSLGEVPSYTIRPQSNLVDTNFVFVITDPEDISKDKNFRRKQQGR